MVLRGINAKLIFIYLIKINYVLMEDYLITIYIHQKNNYNKKIIINVN